MNSERRHSDDIIGGRHRRTVDIEDTVSMTTNNNLGKRGLLHQSQVLRAQHPKPTGQSQCSPTKDKFMECVSGIKGRVLVAVPPQQKSKSATPTLPNSSLPDAV